MPLFQYFGWVEAFALAALAANWCFPAPISPQSDVSLDQKINIRIHTDHKWPDRVVLDATGATLVQEAGAGNGIGGSEPAAVAERQPLDAFAEMTAIPESQGRVFDRLALPSGCRAERRGLRKFLHHLTQARVAARKELTFPSRLHKLPGRS